MNIKSFFTMYNYFTASLNSFSALNAGVLESAIHISATLLYRVLKIPTGILTINRFTLLVSILGILILTDYLIFMYRSPKTTKIEKSRLIAYIPLFIATTMFWAIQEQGAIILASYADQRTQLKLDGIELQSSWFQSLNPIYIVLLALCLVMDKA